ncbi:MAG: ABC transporter ATP-binding protein [Solirubrobacterales bacterium]
MAATLAPVLEAADIRKSYGDWLALQAVSLTVRPGELVACIGPNGAGKTTLLTILAGIQRPDSGTIETNTPAANSRDIGWVPQQPAIYRKLTVAENLRLFARLERVSDIDGAVERMLAQTGLEERAAEQARHLSGGNQQRLNIAIGVLSSPSLLLLDEPTSSLDPRQRSKLWEFIKQLSEQGAGVVYSTHVVSEAERYADRVLVLADGERLFWGSPQELERIVPAKDPETGYPDFEATFVGFLQQQGH